MLSVEIALNYDNCYYYYVFILLFFTVLTVLHFLFVNCFLSDAFHSGDRSEGPISTAVYII